MQLKWLAIPIISACAVLSYAPPASAVSLITMEEPVTPLVTLPSVSYMKYDFNGATYVQEPLTASPLLCGSTSAPTTNQNLVSPIYYSPNGLPSATPFVFGAAPGTPDRPAVAVGGSVSMVGSTMQLVGDPALVCYGLDANGVHGPTPGVMRDEFEGPTYSPTLQAAFNSSVVLTVFHVPANSGDYYGYTVDVSIAAAPVGANCGVNDCNFALLEGFDSSVFATNSSATHPDEGWCIGSAGSTACSTSTVEGGININYSTWPNSFLPHLVAGATPLSYRFVVKRYFAANVTTLPASGAPLAIAALFSPFDMDENFIGDNVAAGTKDLPNTAPAVVATGDAWTAFSNGLASLVENTDSGTLSFSATDPDTQGSMAASVTLNLPGDISVVAQANCSAATPPPDQQAAANCTLAIPLSNAAWWNASVASGYDGLFNALATDATNGTYAPGVAASAQVVVRDALGKPSAPVTVPVHINSSVNNAPVTSYSNAFVMATDPQSNHVYPTMTCSVSLGSAAGGCGAVDRFGSIQVNVMGSITTLPGPAAAFDELATQGTAVVNYSNPQDAFTNVQCNRQQQAQIFATNGGPIVTVSSGVSTVYDMNFVISGTPPAATVGAICMPTFTDVGPFPNGQSAVTSTSAFRLVVNP